MPFHAQLYTKPPHRYLNGQWLLILYESSTSSIEKILPRPLEPADEPIVAVFIAKFPVVQGMGTYLEAGMLIKSKLKELTGYYVYELFVTSDSAMACGREIWGSPKKMADITLKDVGEIVLGKMIRNSVEILTLTFKREMEVKPEELPSIFPTFCYKMIPSVSGDGYDVRQITTASIDEVEVLEAWSGPATISINPSATTKMHLIEPKRIISGYYFRMSHTQKYGKVLYDYLSDRYFI